ncbi:Arc family DNA-binding protein [Brucella sp. 6810]|uniref:Arc family DNA-binding protein n=1 Tax=Brucella sp. 6810 TaxID=2769351 RepID=UPI00165C23DE|nr:Arc family DNA-binding protein [Brucella sp. 6810]QNQ62417.1 Arc family DNA-binding protein [Brucella sp. 6810]
MMPRKKYPSDFKDKSVVRFPDGMMDWIKASAAKNDRSMNGEIIHILRERMKAAAGEEIGVTAPAAQINLGIGAS